MVELGRRDFIGLGWLWREAPEANYTFYGVDLLPLCSHSHPFQALRTENMSLQVSSIPATGREVLCKHAGQSPNLDKDSQAMGRIEQINFSYGRCSAGLLGIHRWIFCDSSLYSHQLTQTSLVLRTAYSAESNELWVPALDKLRRWVSQYLMHLHD